MVHEHVVAGIATALRAGALTADAVALEARKWGEADQAVFNELFARLSSHRDRALVAFWISTGARASEQLGVLCSGADPGQQLITVVRKGSRALQQLPASLDAFVWLRL
jgi:site-specific recombinase XerC